jgi:cytoskeletal protein CcmA (bactofilin family)
MFGKKKINIPQQRIDSLIGVDTTVTGSISFSGGLRIDGQVKGDITAVSGQESTLVLSEKAKVTGEVHVTHVVINGQVDGPVYASEYLELLANARVMGDVHYKTLEIQVGAVVEGRLYHSDSSEPKLIEDKRENKLAEVKVETKREGKGN